MLSVFPPEALRHVCMVSMRPGLRNPVSVLNNASEKRMDDLEQSSDSVLHHGKKKKNSPRAFRSAL